MPKGIEMINITAQSAIYPWTIFAPSWNLVNSYKQKAVTEKEYTDIYTEQLRKEYRKNRILFEQIISKALTGNIALACYCPAGEFCHRLILKNVLQILEPRLIYYGEYPANQSLARLHCFDRRTWR